MLVLLGVDEYCFIYRSTLNTIIIIERKTVQMDGTRIQRTVLYATMPMHSNARIMAAFLNIPAVMEYRIAQITRMRIIVLVLMLILWRC